MDATEKQTTLQQAVEAWQSLCGRRDHLEANLALSDPSDVLRQELVALTKAHPRYADKYVGELAKLPALRDLAACVDSAELLATRSVDVQDRVRLVLALDCEMVETVADNMALARVSAVDVQGKTVLDLLVLPCEASFIEDCRTAITGLEKIELVKRGVSKAEAQERFAALCCGDTLLIGHALDHDLLALGIRHDIVIDTSHVFAVLSADLRGPQLDRLHSLDFLSQRVLQRDMDRAKHGGVHDSLEDSRNALDLAKYALLSMRRTGLAAPPPLAAKARRQWARGQSYGFAAALQGRQDYANLGVASALVSADGVQASEMDDFYALRLGPSLEEGQALSIPSPVAKPGRPALAPQPIAPDRSAPLAMLARQAPVVGTFRTGRELADELRVRRLASEQSKRVRSEGNKRMERLKGKVLAHKKRSKLFQ